MRPETASAMRPERILAVAILALGLMAAFLSLPALRLPLLAAFAIVGLVRVLALAMRTPATGAAEPAVDIRDAAPNAAESNRPEAAVQEATPPDPTEPTSPDEILHWALVQAMRMSGGTTGSIMLLDPQSGALRIAAARGLPPEVISSTVVRPGEGVAGIVLESGRPVIVEDSPYSTRPPRRADVRSAVSVPISDERFVVGVLNVGRPHHPAAITDEQVDELRSLGSRIAAALADGDRALQAIMDSL